MGSILVVGSANYDLVWRAKKLPLAGETVLGDSFATFAGGKGANQAVAAGRLGADVFFCGCIGTDSFGDELLQSLNSSHVKTEYIRRVDEPTGNAAILVDECGANQIVVAPGANAKLSPEDVRAAIEAIQPDIVLAQLEIPLDCVEAAAKSARRFVLNPAPARMLKSSLLAKCFALVPNESEANLLCGGAFDPNVLLGMGIENLIVTQGSNGVSWFIEDACEVFSSYRVDAVDTTAAGDVFCGALCALLAEERSLSEAIQFANAAAAVSVTRHGAQSSAPIMSEVTNLLERS